MAELADAFMPRSSIAVVTGKEFVPTSRLRAWGGALYVLMNAAGRQKSQGRGRPAFVLTDVVVSADVELLLAARFTIVRQLSLLGKPSEHWMSFSSSSSLGPAPLPMPQSQGGQPVEVWLGVSV